jgi:hypothetical protein
MGCTLYPYIYNAIGFKTSLRTDSKKQIRNPPHQYAFSSSKSEPPRLIDVGNFLTFMHLPIILDATRADICTHYLHSRQYDGPNQLPSIGCRPNFPTLANSSVHTISPPTESEYRCGRR